jgi:glycosyltransferase involved in cell wall biosynthesis
MSFGKPVAATAAGGIPEAVADGETGLLVPVGDAAALGSAIARLLTDCELASQMGANGIRRAPMFSIDNTVAKTLEVYERVLAARPR